jgi:hypothetical protein
MRSPRFQVLTKRGGVGVGSVAARQCVMFVEPINQPAFHI